MNERIQELWDKAAEHRLSYLDHKVLVHKDKHRPAFKWCFKQFGAQWNPINNRTGRWSMFWQGRDYFDKYRFCFATEQDMIWFQLKWA